MDTESLRSMVRLFEARDLMLKANQHQTIAMVHHSLRRQAPGAAEHASRIC